MKFLLFNVTVGCALVYLLTGGDLSRLNLPQDVTEKLSPDKVRELVEEHTPDAVKDAMEKIAASEPDAKPEPKPEPQPETAVAAAPPPAMPKEVQIAKHTPVPPAATPTAAPAPVVQQSQPEPQIAATPSADLSAQDLGAETPSVTDAGNRRQALQDLIRDMERMANDKLLR